MPTWKVWAAVWVAAFLALTVRACRNMGEIAPRAPAPPAAPVAPQAQASLETSPGGAAPRYYPREEEARWMVKGVDPSKKYSKTGGVPPPDEEEGGSPEAAPVPEAGPAQP